MKTILRIPAIFRDTVGAATFDELTKIYPEGVVRAHAFQAFLPDEDVRSQSIVNVLKASGLRPWTDKSRLPDRSCEYILHFEHEYEAADWSECLLLALDPPEAAGNPGAVLRGEDGRIIVPEDRMPRRKWAFYGGSANSIFVPVAVKALLEQSDLVGLRFYPTNFIPRDLRKGDTDATVRARHGDPYWELDSDKRMPPLAPSVTLINNEGIPLPHGSEGPGFPREGLFINPQLHYRASDLAKLEPFDIARTYERYQAYDAPGDRPLIVSRRFYQFCVEHGLKGGWAPVVIDPD